MTRLSLFNSPLLLGFDHFERVIDRVAKNTSDGFPPYNIEQTSEGGIRITVAVAGFSKEDLHVSVEDNQLVIRGKHLDDEKRMFLHRGIATRQFQKTFILAEGIEVAHADYSSGLLHINIIRPHVERKVKTISITEQSGSESSAAPKGATTQQPIIQIQQEAKHP